MTECMTPLAEIIELEIANAERLHEAALKTGPDVAVGFHGGWMKAMRTLLPDARRVDAAAKELAEIVYLFLAQHQRDSQRGECGCDICVRAHKAALAFEREAARA